MLDATIKQIEQYENFLIIFHESPDGDAIGSSLALRAALRSKGKAAVLACKDPVPAVFSFLLPDGVEIVNDFLSSDYDAIITIDCGDSKRTGFPDRVKDYAKHSCPIINIDHHNKNDLHRIAQTNYIDSEAAATAELVYLLLEKMSVKIDKTIATWLLTGLYTDTGGFQHANTSPQVYRIASKLLSCGGKLRQITDNINLNRPLASLKLWGRVMSRAWRSKNGVIVSLVTLKDIEEDQASADDLAGVVNILNTIPDSKAAILFVELPDGKIKASLRTEHDQVDVSALAAVFGGGGHRKASGFTIDGEIGVNDEFGWSVKLT